ncbi:MAG: hypothetical protein ABWY23_06070 [Mycetocola sp.]
MDKTKIWIVASSIVMAGILALGWFVGIDPQLQAKAATDELRESVDAQNEATQLAIGRLKGDFEKIDELRTELAGLRSSIPESGNMPAFLTQLDNVAKASKTTVTALSVSEAVEYTAPATAVEVVPEAETGAEPAPEAEAVPDAAAAPVDEAAADVPSVITDSRVTSANFVVIPVTVTVEGDAAGARSFLDKLQHGARLFLATNISIAPKDIEAGSFSATVGGYVYVLLKE